MKSKRYEKIKVKYKDGHEEEFEYPTKCEIRRLNIDAYVAAVITIVAFAVFGEKRLMAWAAKKEAEADKRYRERKSHTMVFGKTVKKSNGRVK